MTSLLREVRFFVYQPNLPFTAYMFHGKGARPHWHTYVELLYVVEGRYSITIGKDDYAALPGDFFIINSEETHATNCTSSKIDHSLLVIQFEPSVIFSSLGSLFEFAYLVPFLKNEVRYAKYVRLRRDSGLKQILKNVLREFSSRRPGFELEIKGDIYRVFAWLIRKGYVSVSSKFESTADHLTKFKSLFEFISSNFFQDISLQSASGLVFMSTSHFCRVFKGATGMSFVKYLNLVRLRESEKLLIASARSIATIAMDVGFSTVSYFNRLFKSQNGISPKLFREQNRIIHKQN